MTRLGRQARRRAGSMREWVTKPVSKAALAVAAISLAGCEGMVITQEVDGSPGGTHGWDWTYFTRSGRLPLEVLGNPSAEPQARFDAALAELMSDSLVGPAVSFEPASGAAAREGQRLAVLFANERSGFGVLPCEVAPADAPAVSRNPLVVYVAMCDGPETLRAVRGVVDVGGGDFDRALRAVIGQTLLDLTLRNGHGGGGGDDSGAQSGGGAP